MPTSRGLGVLEARKRSGLAREKRATGLCWRDWRGGENSCFAIERAKGLDPCDMPDTDATIKCLPA